MTGKADNNTTVVIPLALTDFAKALRELIAAFRDVVGVVRDGVDIARRRKAGEAAADLDFLSFQPDGFLLHLRKFAEGDGAEADADALAHFAKNTSQEVVDRIAALREYRDTVREQCGRDAADKLSNLIDGPNGKFVIRYEIDGLLHLWRGGGSSATVAEQASRILPIIAKFNEDLTGLHDAIFPPRGAPK